MDVGSVIEWFFSLDWITLGLIALVGMGGGFVQRVSGFGLGIFVMLFLPYLTPEIAIAATVSCLFSCGTSTYNAVKYIKKVNFKLISPVLIASMLILPIAVYFSAEMPQRTFEYILGAVLIVLSIYFIFFNEKIKMRRSTKNGIISGGLGGVLNGLFSTGGPPVVLYLSQVANDNMEYFAGIQFYFCVTNIFATVLRAFNGLVTKQAIIMAAFGFIGCMIGDAVGSLVFDRLNAKKLKFIIYIGMIISGVLMIIKEYI